MGELICVKGEDEAGSELNRERGGVGFVTVIAGFSAVDVVVNDMDMVVVAVQNNDQTNQNKQRVQRVLQTPVALFPRVPTRLLCASTALAKDAKDID